MFEISNAEDGLVLMKNLVKAAEENGAKRAKIFVDILDMTVELQGVLLGIDQDDGSAAIIFQAHKPNSMFARTLLQLTERAREAYEKDQDDTK